MVTVRLSGIELDSRDLADGNTDTMSYQQTILLVGKKRAKLKRVAQSLSAYNLESSVVTSLKRTQEKLHSERYVALMIHENITNGDFASFFHTIRTDDPTLVLVACVTEVKGLMEEKLFNMDVDDVIMDVSRPNVIAKRIVDRIEIRCIKYREDSIIRLGGVVIDKDNLRVWNRGKCCRISKGLIQLLEYFLANRARAISRMEMCESFWADSIIDPEGKNLDMQVSKLRRLIEPDPKNPTFILTVRGVGYMLCPPGWTPHP
jgi:DNA-binding response OmpR family regulator